VAEALSAQADVQYICYAPDLLESAFAHDLIAQHAARGLRCYALAPDIFRSLAEKDNPQGILAVVRSGHFKLDTLTPSTHPWLVALVAPQDPGNIGAILRSMDAVGASGLILLDGGADPYHPNAVRASMGALFWMPIVSASFAEFAQWARGQGYRLYGTSAHGVADYQTVAYARPAVLLLGSEQKGLSAEQAAACETLVQMPMAGKVTSLNLAVAAGIMLYAMRA
jgi:TrmH family RNA methyltransferase